MKDHIRKLAVADALAKRKRNEEAPYEDKRAFIFSRGWVESKSQLSIELHKLSPDFYRKEGITAGLTLNMAYEIEVSQMEDEARQADLKAETAKCYCNKCGADLQKFITNTHQEVIPVGYYGLVDAHVSGGFESVDLADCTSYTFSLCEKCLSELFEQFLKPPKIKSYL